MLIQNNSNNKKDQAIQFPQIPIVQTSQKTNIIKNVRISLTMDDILKNVHQLAKQQIIEKFRLLLDRKELQINQKIQRNNIDHLLLLQKKMLTIQNKTYENFKLNNQVTSLKRQLSQQKNKNVDLIQHNDQLISRTRYMQKYKTEWEQTMKQQKAKRQKLKKQHQQLKTNYKNLTYSHQEQIRSNKKLRQQKKNFDQQLDFLLKNHLQSYDAQMKNKLNNVTLDYQFKINQVTAAYNQQKKKSQLFEARYIEAKNKINKLNKAMQVINRELMNEKNKQILQKEMQSKFSLNKDSIRESIRETCVVQVKRQVNDQTTSTQDCLIQQAFLSGALFRKDFLDSFIEKHNKQFLFAYIQSNKKKQCDQCKVYKNNVQNLEHQINILKKKIKQSLNYRQRDFASTSKYVPFDKIPHYSTQGTQTMEIPKPQLKSIATQKTCLTAVDKQEQIKIIKNFDSIKNSSNKLIQNWKNRYYQMQKIYENRPSKAQDIKRLNQLQKQIIKLNFWLGEKHKCIQYQEDFIRRLQIKLSEQFFIMDQVNIQQLQIKNAKTNRNTLDAKSACGFVTPNINLEKMRKFSLNQQQELHLKSKTYSFISQPPPSSNSMTRSKKVKNQRNTITSYIQRQSSSKLKHPIEESPRKIEEQATINPFLVGVIFTQQNKDKSPQLSQLRRYKKYRSSFKKVRN